MRSFRLNGLFRLENIAPKLELSSVDYVLMRDSLFTGMDAWSTRDTKSDPAMMTDFMKKPLTAAMLLASAAGGPYLLYETDVGRQAMNGTSGILSSSGESGTSSFWSALGYDSSSSGWDSGAYHGPIAPVAGGTQELWDYTVGVPSLDQLQNANPSQPLVGGPVRDLREVLRFDIGPGWVAQNFARVSTVLSEFNLDGLRVPVVTGTSQADLAATITYYFDNKQQLRRINLQGLTGDPSGNCNAHATILSPDSRSFVGGHLYTTKWNSQSNIDDACGSSTHHVCYGAAFSIRDLFGTQSAPTFLMD